MKLISKIALTVSAVALVATVSAVNAKERHKGFGAHHERGAMSHQGRGRSMARIGEMMETYDQNGDGALTQEEIDTIRAARLVEFDKDGNGTLNLEEYQALWLDAMHERMVDQFQAHDADGDGLVTAEEFGKRQSKMVSRMDRNDDGKLDKSDFEFRRQKMRKGMGGDKQAPAE